MSRHKWRVRLVYSAGAAGADNAGPMAYTTAVTTEQPSEEQARVAAVAQFAKMGLALPASADDPAWAKITIDVFPIDS